MTYPSQRHTPLAAWLREHLGLGLTLLCLVFISNACADEPLPPRCELLVGDVEFTGSPVGAPDTQAFDIFLFNGSARVTRFFTEGSDSVYSVDFPTRTLIDRRQQRFFVTFQPPEIGRFEDHLTIQTDTCGNVTVPIYGFGVNQCGGPCDTPPPASCDGSLIASYEPIGRCIEGTCEYGRNTTLCPFGCAGGACRENSPPRLGRIRITPERPKTDDDLCVELDTPPVDPDGDQTYVAFTWTSDRGETILGQNCLRSSRTTKGQTWTVAVTASDGHATTTATASATIENSLCKITAQSLMPTQPVIGDTLFASASATDADGDPVTLAFLWLENGVTVPMQQSSTLLLARNDFVSGDVVTVQITCDDGEETGQTVMESVLVEATAETCYTVLQSMPNSPDGIYHLDPDGSGPILPLPVWCDMQNGGWTRVTVHPVIYNDNWFCAGPPTLARDLATNPLLATGKLDDALADLFASARREVRLRITGTNHTFDTTLSGTVYTTAGRIQRCSWQCNDGTTAMTACLSEQRGCGPNGVGDGGAAFKLYVGSDSAEHPGRYGLLVNLCGYTGHTQSVGFEIYVR